MPPRLRPAGRDRINLTPADRYYIHAQVKIHGRSVQDVADEYGIARFTVNNSISWVNQHGNKERRA